MHSLVVFGVDGMCTTENAAMVEGALVVYASGDKGIENHYVLFEHILLSGTASDASTLWSGRRIPCGVVRGVCNRFVSEVLSVGGKIKLNKKKLGIPELSEGPGSASGDPGSAHYIEKAQNALWSVLQSLATSVFDLISGTQQNWVGAFPVVFSQEIKSIYDSDGVEAMGCNVDAFFRLIVIPLVIRQKLEQFGWSMENDADGSDYRPRYRSRAVIPFQAQLAFIDREALAGAYFDVSIIVPHLGLSVGVVKPLFASHRMTSQVVVFRNNFFND
eukprot:3933212-Rhodomonas_salina.1